MDALGHVFDGDTLYNGFPADSMSTYGGLAHCGIEKAGPVVARGVLFDVGPLAPVTWSPSPSWRPAACHSRPVRWRSSGPAGWRRSTRAPD